MKKTIQLNSTDNKNHLHVVIWEPETEPKAILQISHGMCEYIERYSEFAEYMNNAGILVIGNDHLGHGKSVKTDDDLGYFGGGMSRTLTDDLRVVNEYAHKNYPNIPLILLGHSFGSFLARNYIQSYSDTLNAAIICGTGYTPEPVLGLGRLTASVIKLFKGERYRSPMLKKMAFGSYLNKIPDAETPNDWLSKNRASITAYNADKYCTFLFTVNGYLTMFEVLKSIQNKNNIKKIPASFPVLFIAGEMDPVGSYGKGVKKVYKMFRSAGLMNTNIQLYKDDRHELLNELDRTSIYYDVLDFITLICK